MRKVKYLLYFLLLALPLSGCAFGTDYVKINEYRPDTAAEKTGTDMVIYVVKAEDNRAQPEYVGQKAAGYVALENGLDLQKIVTNSVVSCLESAGCTVKYTDDLNSLVAKEGHPVKVLHTSIDEFWTVFVSGFWTVDANAKAKLSFQIIEHGTNRILWQKKIGKGAVDSSAMGATPGLFEDSLNDALSEIMKEFQNTIRSAEFKNAVFEQAGS